MPPELQNNQPPNSNPGPTPQTQPSLPPRPTLPSQMPDPQPSVSSQPVYGQQPPTPQQSFQPLKNKKRKRKLIVIATVVFLFLGGSAGAYFGLYLPNQPDQVWDRALTNSAKGYDKLVEYGDKQGGSKGGTIKGNFKAEAGSLVFDGSLDSKFYEQNSSTKLDAGAAGTRFNFELLTNVPQGAKSPDLYAKVSGLKGIDSLFGEDGLGASLAASDNQWYFVDHTLFDQIEKSASQSGEAAEMPTFSQDDVVAIANSVGKVNREYIFTTDSSKAVLTKKQNVGKETIDERSVYHYKVGYDKAHLKTYVTALKDELKNTKLKSYIDDKYFDEINQSIDKMDGNSEADAWVDMKTKLIRKVRFTENGKPDSYMDIGIKYTGGDEYPFTLDIYDKDQSGEGKISLKATLNAKTNNIAFGADADIKEGSQESFKFNLTGTYAPSNDQVEFKKPENAKSILEAYGQLLGGLQSSSESLLQSNQNLLDDVELQN